MTIQNILSPLRRAVSDYKMINDGDNVAVGLSGGKDSLTLLTALAAYRRFSPEKFTLSAVMIDLGFKETDKTQIAAIAKHCECLNVPFTLIPSDIAEIVFEHRKEKNPCSLCSKMRRGALCSYAKENKINKLALGHHADDLSETFLLSMFYEGRLSVFKPVSFMDKTDVTVIRPLILTEEKDISAFAKQNKLPVLFNPCPADKNTKREYVKNLIKSVSKEIPCAKNNLFGAIISKDRYNLFE